MKKEFELYIGFLLQYFVFQRKYAKTAFYVVLTVSGI